MSGARRSSPGTFRRFRMRRGTTLVEYTLTSALSFTFLFGIVEFSYISTTRQGLMNGVTRASRHGATGGTLAEMRADVRAGSGRSIDDSYIEIKYNPNDDASGDEATWLSAVDDPTTGTPPLANAVPLGKPLRVTVRNWPYQMLTGRMFSWMQGPTPGKISMTATNMTRREY